MKKSLLCGILIGVNFIWIGSSFMSLLYHSLDFYSSSETTLFTEILGYSMQVFGMALFVWLMKHSPQKAGSRKFFGVLLLIEATVISFMLSSACGPTVLVSGLLLNFFQGLAAGWYLTLLSTAVPKKYRARTFGFGYAAGSICSFLLSIPMNGTFLSSVYVIVPYLVIIGISIVLLKFCPDINMEISRNITVVTNPPGHSPGKLLFFMILLFFVTHLVGFAHPPQELTGGVNWPLTRAFYAIGLALAGIISDKSRRYGMILAFAALVCPFVLIALRGHLQIASVVWAIFYLFVGFLVVFRVVVFCDYAAQSQKLVPYAVLGFLSGRIGEVIGTTVGNVVNDEVGSLTILIVLFLLSLFLFLTAYRKLYFPISSTSNIFYITDTDESILSVFAEKYGLTPREKDVLAAAIYNDKAAKEIAYDLQISERMVQRYFNSIYEKTGTQGRVGLTLLYSGKNDDALSSSPDA